MSALQRGSTMPDFRLPASTGQTLERGSFAGKVPVVVFFLTDHRTEGDRERIETYDRLLSEFGAERVQVLGVLKETAADVRRLAGEMDVNVPLLADAGGDMARDFDVPVDEAGPERFTIVANASGTIVGRFGPDDDGGAPDEVLDLVKSLSD
jgi:thioredoxin-dependent peroxiredoxin